MLAFCMHTLDLFKHRIVYFTTAKVSVKLFIGKSHLTLIGLSVKQAGRGRFFYNALGSLQPTQKFVYLRDGQIVDGVKIVCAVAPLGEVADIGFAAVARSGNEAIFRRAIA